jgi:prepilin-type N-terminal cleavage/methylation domain-containing protein
MPSVSKSQSAFSLLELMAVIAVVAVITVVSVSMFRTAQEKGRDSIRKNNLQQLSIALEGYLQKNNKYIPSGISGGNCNAGSGTDTANFYSLIATYVDGSVPLDPLGSQYCYISVNNGKSYRLFAKLENCQDSDVISPTTCATDNFNYSRVSPDLTIALAPSGGGGAPPPPVVTPPVGPPPSITPPGPPPPPSDPLWAGLVGYWRFEESAGSTVAADSSGKGFNATYKNGATTTNNGRIGKAASLDGNNDHIEIANTNFSISNSNHQFTIAMWIKPKATGGNRVLADNIWGSANGGWQSMLQGNSLLACLPSDSSGYDSTNNAPFSFSDANWYHIVCVFDNNTEKIYVNGFQRGSTLNVTHPIINPLRSTFIGAGNSAGNPTDLFEGEIDEVGFWNRALISSEISSLYGGSTPPITSPAGPPPPAPVVPPPPAPAGPAPVFDASSGIPSTGGAVEEILWSHTTASGTNRFLVVGVSFNNSLNQSVYQVRYGASSLQQAGIWVNGNIRTEFWYLKNPASGTANIRVTLNTDTHGIVAGATTWTNVNQTNSFIMPSANSGTSTNASSNFGISSNQVGVMVLGAGDSNSAIFNATGTPGQPNDWNGINSCGGCAKVVGAGTHLYSGSAGWTLNASKPWVVLGIILNGL